MKEKYLNELVYIGTNAALKPIIFDYGKEIYKNGFGNCKTKSISWPIINSLVKIYSSNELFRGKLMEFTGIKSINAKKITMVAEYSKSYEAWVKSEFDSTFQLNLPKDYFFYRYCPNPNLY